MSWYYYLVYLLILLFESNSPKSVNLDDTVDCEAVVVPEVGKRGILTKFVTK